ncbi:MAG: glycosyltransferase family 4 protein [Planctomycetes bacterium]|nr:glycosyltransferase family 4 protein [Planctomycetota bacterium]
MKILHVITRLVLGGAQENTVLTCEGLHERGHEVTLVTGPALGPEGELLERARRGGYRVVVIDEMRREIHPWRDWRTYRALRRIFREDRPDVVHTHSSKAGFLGRRAARDERVPLVAHTIHGLPFHDYQSRVAHAVFLECERAAGEWCDLVFCVGEVMKEKAVAAGLGSPEKFEVVYSGMEVERFLEPRDRAAARAALAIPPDAVVAGVVSRLAPLKGHEHLIEAAEGLHLLFVGDGERRAELETLARRRGVPVTFAGLVSPERIPEMLAAMDLLVHTSFREGLPRAIPQAVIAGVPVAAFDCDGAREVVRPGITGELVPPGDTDGLHAAIALVRGLRVPDAVRRDFAGRFDRRNMVVAIEMAYRKGSI